MKHDLGVYRDDLVRSCRNIKSFIAEISEADYAGNILVKSAVERQFEIIGEVLSRMSREFPLAYAVIRNARRIIDFRNIISHGYDVVSDERIFQIAKENIDELEEDALKIVVS